MRIYLIGMMGSGKSTLGKELSKRLGYKFIDMDHYIEEKCCKFIDEIFREYGEEWFRAFETNTLKEFLEMDDVIIATGGGVIKNKKHKKLMDGKCIYLSVPVEILEERLAFDDTRPLLKTRSVRSILEERIPLYEYFSDLTVENIDMKNDLNLLKLKEGDFVIKISLLKNYKILIGMGKIVSEILRNGEKYVIMGMFSLLERERGQYEYVSKADDIRLIIEKDIEVELLKNSKYAIEEIDSYLFKIKDNNNKIYDKLVDFTCEIKDNEMFNYINNILGIRFELIEESWCEK